MPTDRWMTAEEVAHICNGVLLGHEKREEVAHICNRILLGHEKREVMPFAATCMDLEMSHTKSEGQIPYDIIHMWNLKI